MIPKRFNRHVIKQSSLKSMLVCGLCLTIAAMDRAHGETPPKTLTIYCGRGEDLVGPIIDAFKTSAQCEVKLRYGNTAELAATILEEGDKSPADVFFAQDSGALAALAHERRFATLPAAVLDRVNPRFHAEDGSWVGVSGRARVVVYNTNKLKEADLPDDLIGFCDPQWKGRIGWAPANGSFQSYVTTLRAVEGEDKAKRWLTCIQANQPKIYPKNAPIVAAVGAGEIDVGFVNHYYLYRFLKESGETFPARNYYPRAGKVDAMMNVAGAGVLASSKNQEIAVQLIRHLLAPSSQEHFANQTYEYPLAHGIKTNPLLLPLDQIHSPQLDFNAAADLKTTLELLQSLGVL